VRGFNGGALLRIELVEKRQDRDRLHGVLSILHGSPKHNCSGGRYFFISATAFTKPSSLTKYRNESSWMGSGKVSPAIMFALYLYASRSSSIACGMFFISP